MPEDATTTAYARFVAEMAADDRVAGLMLTGSRAIGCQTAASDCDVIVVVRDDVDPEEAHRWSTDLQVRHEVLALDLTNGGVQSLREFDAYAESGNLYYWQRYDLTHARLEFDRSDGRITAALDRKRVLSVAEVDTILHGSVGLPYRLSGFVETAYRSVTSTASGRVLEALFSAGCAVQHAVPCLFALHRRVMPYQQYLGWELEHHPLAELSWPPAQLIDTLTRVMTTADPAAVRALFWELERIARANNAADKFDEWGGKLFETMRGA